MNYITYLLTFLQSVSHVFNENEDIHEEESDNEIKLYMMCGTHTQYRRKKPEQSFKMSFYYYYVRIFSYFLLQYSCGIIEL